MLKFDVIYIVLRVKRQIKIGELIIGLTYNIIVAHEEYN